MLPTSNMFCLLTTSAEKLQNAAAQCETLTTPESVSKKAIGSSEHQLKFTRLMIATYHCVRVPIKVWHTAIISL